MPGLSVLDLMPVPPGRSVGEAIAAGVEFARLAESLGYRRVWYAEHHNLGSIASSATSVLIAHVAAHTSTITLGSGGVMLPNHAPLVIAEQFGTLAAAHPGRIELGVGRAPGTDQVTLRALRRDVASVDRFPEDVRELQGYLGDRSLVPGVEAVPGRGTHVPVFILGSSLYGAQLAAALGLPYAFASHFAPADLHAAVARYRSEFRPSPHLDRPHVLAGVNVVVAPTAAEALAELAAVRRMRVKALLRRPGVLSDRGPLSDAEADAALASPAGRHVDQMLSRTAVGEPDDVRAYLELFRTEADADELITVHQAASTEGRMRSLRLTAEACTPTTQERS